MCVRGVHRIEFSPPLTLNLEERISVSVNCSWPSQVTRKRVAETISIGINLRDIECMRNDQGVKSYRKKERKIEVLVNGHHSLLATTTPIIQSCERFRLLIIGNSGVGKSSLLHKVFGVEGVHTSEAKRGIADIDREFISLTNERFVVHDSLGFESGDEGNMKIVKDFVARRKAMPHLKDQLHAIWLCLETPYAGGRLLEGGVDMFLQRRANILGEIPLVVVLTKVDQLDIQLELDPPANENVEQYKSRYLDKHCIGPLHAAAGSDITHVAVSVQDGYSESLSNLVGATDKNMAKYHTDEAPRVVASIAQRVSIKEKIELSIIVGKRKYWKMLLKCAVFRSHTVQVYLQVIRKDVITIWNFNDPHQYLMDDNIIGALLCTDKPVGTPAAPPNTTSFASFASLLGSALEALKCLSGSGEIILSLVGATADIAISTARTMMDAYREAKGDVRILMAYVVDLICIMQAIFLLTSGGRITVTTKTINLALRAYEQPKKIVHLMVDALDGNLGRDLVLDKIEELIWRYSIADNEIEELRRKIDEVLPSSSS
ncbi:hypothetical protein JVT61DRAFT_2532 [Boletus reticuloceps]|uniref:G domain-containing protein n=1 Tax=Boletus reticuloceps TaxID=495285 RepID=A0A8I3A983_9AGAM|nr:hypothetical protein JVT61DRAFT_2532 [Boletus reticuloceps]